MDSTQRSGLCLNLLSILLFRPEISETSELIAECVSDFTREDFGQLWELATTHHVIQRAFGHLYRVMAEMEHTRAGWVKTAITAERARIRKATSFLLPICQALQDAGDVIVIKSLDHWPDLGSDLDLYTTAEGRDVASLMHSRFRARLAERSWGDRLANKWNFIIPGLPELVEVHCGRLGQTGEQVSITECLVARSREEHFGPYLFRVPRPEDRIVISTLQRMYRHFYLRLCDVVDMTQLIDSDDLDYSYLEGLSGSAGIWDGVATYLVVLAEYVERYGKEMSPLPAAVIKAARFGSLNIKFSQQFLRIPIFPQATNLYAKEWGRLLSNGEVENTLRLSLLPGLAAAAALAAKITGSDKGIW